MTKVATGVLIATAILLVMSAAQPAGQWDRGSDATVQALQEEMTRMEGRVEKLEALAAMDAPAYFGSSSAPQPKSKSTGPPQRVMKFDGMESADPDPEAQAQLKQMQREADALEKTALSQGASAARTGSYGGYRGGSRSSSWGSRQREAEGDVYAMYQQQHRKKQGEVKKLERELAQPKQIIHGSWKGKIISLRTTKDLTPKLNKIDVGGYLTWEGRRIREDEVSQEWVVWNIQRVDPWEVE